ncbi:MAG: Uma2 family endonuclease [Chloroflexota bacterium]
MVPPGSTGRRARRAFEGAPDLLIEIVSPGNRWHDEVRKRRRYAVAGVRESWIVDCEIDAVGALTLAGGVFQARTCFDGEVLASSLLDGMMLPVADVFAGVDDLDEHD